MQPVKHFIIHHIHMSIAFVPVLLISCAKSHFLPIKRGLWSIFFIHIVALRKQIVADILLPSVAFHSISDINHIRLRITN